MRTRSWAPLVLALWALAVAAPAQTNSPPPEPATELKALMDDWGKASRAFSEKLQRAKTDAEREALFKNEQPTRDFLSRFRALEERARGTETGARALLWIFQYGGDGDAPGAGSEFVKSLTGAYLQMPVLEYIVPHLGYGVSLGKEETDRALRTIAAQSTHRRVKAAATFTLARVLAEAPRRGNAAVPSEARALFESVKKEYADTPYGKQAEGYLFEVDHLRIGRKAPDFEATDQDGKKFKLSDYRGKVVVLDFWGFW